VRTGTAPSRGYVISVVVREVVLWLGAVVGVLCLVVAAAAVFFGVTPLVFRSGSMSPSIPTGALALARTTPAGDLSVGDVVSVIRADGERVTHRLVSKKPASGGRWSLVVKGDANSEPDPLPVVTSAADRVFWSTPTLGFVLQDVSKPQFVFPAGALFGMLAVIGFRPPLDRRLLRDPDDAAVGDERTRDDHDHGGGGGGGGGSGDPDAGGRDDVSPRDGADHRDPGRHVREDVPALSAGEVGAVYATRRSEAHSRLRGPAALGVATALAVTGATLGLHTTPTLAAFNDTGSASGTFEASQVPAPDTFTCTVVSLNQIQFNWTMPTTTWTPTSFTLTNVTNATSTQITPGSSRTITVSPPLVSVGGLTKFVFTIQSNLGSASSVAAQTRTVTAVLTLLPTCA
jgi:signal peptidase I